MAYSDFTTLHKVRTAFDLILDETTHLFTDIAPIEPSDYLKTTLNEFVPLAKAINTEKETPIDVIYGAVTTGMIWKFLKLVNQTAFIDLSDYFIKEVDKTLGILSTPLSQHLSLRMTNK
ncbi:MAG: hypothetical protein Fur006_53060 [Coleofasciculaceae cyanobacterium]